LISAYVEQIKPIPAHIVEAVGLELDLVQHPFTISPSAMDGLTEHSVQAKISNAVAPGADLQEERGI
jgi:hypothetical protein